MTDLIERNAVHSIIAIGLRLKRIEHNQELGKRRF